MKNEALLQFVCDTLDDLKARDVAVLDVASMTTMADYIIVASGTSGRHVVSVSNKLVEAVKESGTKPLGVEGREGSEWVLIDLADIIVHVMQPSVREFYKLEDFWSVRPPATVDSPAT